MLIYATIGKYKKEDLMEKKSDFKEYVERKIIAELDYISYLMRNETFAYIVDNIFRKMEIPEYIIKPALTPLEDIRASVSNNTQDFLRGERYLIFP